MIELQSIYRNSFNIHPAAILDPQIEIYQLNPSLNSIRMVNELLLLRNFGITFLRILNLQTQLMILNANLKHFFLCELMNRDAFILFIYLFIYLFILSIVYIYLFCS